MKRFRGTLSILALSLTLQCLFTVWPDLTWLFAFHPDSFMGWMGLIPSMFAHANWPHLIGNFCWGLPFCLYLEYKLGYRRFIEFYVLCGVGGALLQALAVDGGGIGSSGALFGIMAGACSYWGKNAVEHTMALSVFCAHFIRNLLLAPYSAFLGIGFYCHLGGGLTALLLCMRFYAPELTAMSLLPRKAKNSPSRPGSLGKRLKKHPSRRPRLLRLPWGSRSRSRLR